MDESGIGMSEELHVQLVELAPIVKVSVLVGSPIEVTWVDLEGNVRQIQTVTYNG